MINVDSADGAAVWASYLINGDDSGLEPRERELCDSWLAKLAPAYVVSCEEESFFSWSYGLVTGDDCAGGSLLTYILHSPAK